MSADLEEQEDELLALQSIFDSDEFVRNESKAAGEFRVSVELPAAFTVHLKEGETLRQYQISFLPPLHLTFELPGDYPSSSPPSFTLACSWLTHTQLSALTAQLLDLYQATGGAVVLFSWAQFLKEEGLVFLGIHNVLELPSDEHSTHSAALSELNNQHSQSKLTSHHSEVGPPGPESVCDTGCEKPLTSQNSCKTTSEDSDPVDENQAEQCSQPSELKADYENEGAASLPGPTTELLQNKGQTLSDLTPSQILLSQILIYQADQTRKVFASTLFECGVCFNSSLGSECVQLSECDHIFCQACLAEFCRVQITAGNARGVTCPQAGCSATPSPAQVRSLVGEELFTRYDLLLLQSTLDLMSDVVYCPRRTCSSPVIQETSGTAALCSVCNFVFCVTCRKTYHGAGACYNLEPKREEQEGPSSLPETYAGKLALLEDYRYGSSERKRLLEKRYGHYIMVFNVEEMLNDEWMSNNSKSCPHCFTKIEKNGGCDLMSCRQCRQLFCWACLRGRFSDASSGRRERTRDCPSCAFW